MIILFDDSDSHDSILNKLRMSSHKFFLTGSRFFGNVHEGSDWDFFAQDSQELRIFVRDLGLHHDSEAEEYFDSQCVKVYRNFNERIDIQLVRDCKRKELAQEMIRYLPDQFEANSWMKDKRCAREIWSWAYAVAMQIQNGDQK